MKYTLMSVVTVSCRWQECSGTLITMIRPSWLKMYQTGNAQNDVKWSNAKYDKLIQESDKNLDEASRQKQLMEAEKILVSEDRRLSAHYFSPSNQDLIDPSLTGYYTDGLAYTFFYKTKKK